MKISDYKGEDAIDLLADIIDPLSAILDDDEIQKEAEAGEGMKTLKMARMMLKKHKSECIAILARIDGVDVSEYKPTLFQLIKQVLEMLNDDEVQELFTSQGQIEDAANSGSATDNIPGAEV